VCCGPRQVSEATVRARTGEVRAGSRGQDNRLVFPTTTDMTISCTNMLGWHFKPLSKRAIPGYQASRSPAHLRHNTPDSGQASQVCTGASGSTNETSRSSAEKSRSFVPITVLLSPTRNEGRPCYLATRFPRFYGRFFKSLRGS
jgi:hypothetical protein